MNMQLFHCLARRAGMLSLAALPVIGIVGPSEAEPGGLSGSWSGGGWVSAPALATSMNLTILQLENATLPIYQR